MLEVLNPIIIGNIDTVSNAITALLLIVIGIPLVSFKGGIPRIAGQIISKQISIIVLIILAVVVFSAIEPLTDLIAGLSLQQFPEYAIPSILLLSGLALLEFDNKMRWDYRIYSVPLLIIGIALFVLEIVF